MQGPLCVRLFAPLSLDGLADRMEAWHCDLAVVGSHRELHPLGNLPFVLVAGRDFLSGDDSLPQVLSRFDPLRFRVIYLGELGDWKGAGLPEEALHAVLPGAASPAEVYIALRGIYEAMVAGGTIDLLETSLDRFRGELDQILNIGKRLTAERDLYALLRLMLEKSMDITGADAGSIFLVERGPGGVKRLRFKITDTRSISSSYDEFTMPLSKRSLAGYVALTGEPLLIDDAYELSGDLEYSLDRSYDETHGYRTKSMLVVPLIDHKDEILGVIQLINAKRDPECITRTPDELEAQVVPFTVSHKDFIMAIAGQAAVSIENNQLYNDIETLFEGFVEASVTAIESRDPTTSGHSFRVAELTVHLAEIVDRAAEGSYAGTSFTPENLKEIRYASLLHDFGKVGVREEVLVKPKKLLEVQFRALNDRFLWLMRDTQLRFALRKIELLRDGGSGTARGFDQLDRELGEELDRLEDWQRQVVRANEPSPLPETAPGQLREIHGYSYVDHEGRTRPLLAQEEFEILSIPRGSLTGEEWKDMQSHVTHTFEFLRRIPWTQELARVPEVAVAHHEKLDGSGYPLGIPEEKIPLGSRMMTISDIYDALTAADRPYKKAMPHDRALDILYSDMKNGKLDAELLEIFVQCRVFDILKKGD